MVNVNTASMEQLKELKGIGNETAAALIDARPFRSVDDLLKIPHIGKGTLGKLLAQGVVVEGPGLEGRPQRPVTPISSVAELGRPWSERAAGAGLTS